VELAPFYDLVCTRQWSSLSARLAFSVGGTSDPGALGPRQWRAAAKDWTVSPRFLLEIVRETGAALKAGLTELRRGPKALVVPASALKTVGKVVRKLVRLSEALLREGR